jgi:hypothetical protein
MITACAMQSKPCIAILLSHLSAIASGYISVSFPRQVSRFLPHLSVFLQN